ncbi:MAG: CPBP family intramembrane metalloprotease [Ruminococcus sp.]|nr:CPBP family intramembrane metalloprotease [Ruminococcus sp.]
MEKEKDIETITKFDKIKTKTIEIFKGFGTILLYILTANIAAYFLGEYYKSNNQFIAEASQLCTYLILLIVLFIFYHKRLIKDFKEFKKDNINVAFRNWLIGLGVMIISNLIITMIVGNIAANESANRELLTNYPISNIITMVFVGPLIEEITFRASFQKGFDKWYTFALFTGLIFGAAHILTDFSLLGLLFIIPYGALGFFFGKAMYETNNIYTSTLAHVIHNGMCVLLILLF